MKRYSLLFILFGLLSMTFFSACDKDDDDDPMDDDPIVDTCNTDNITYNDVESILNTSCATEACHSAGSQLGSLANYDDAVAFVEFGRILGAIKHEENFSPMPYPPGSDKLEDCEISKIEAWVAAGTPE